MGIDPAHDFGVPAERQLPDRRAFSPRRSCRLRASACNLCTASAGRWCESMWYLASPQTPITSITIASFVVPHLNWRPIGSASPNSRCASARLITATGCAWPVSPGAHPPRNSGIPRVPKKPSPTVSRMVEYWRCSSRSSALLGVTTGESIGTAGPLDPPPEMSVALENEADRTFGIALNPAWICSRSARVLGGRTRRVPGRSGRSGSSKGRIRDPHAEDCGWSTRGGPRP